MTTASLSDIKKELNTLDHARILECCMRLAKYKKENKELLTYLLFESHNEAQYIEGVKNEMNLLFSDLPKGNVYFVKKSLRKILRLANRSIKYSGIKSTEIDVRIHFCKEFRKAGIPMAEGTVLYNLYQQQLKKINSALEALPEDLRFDYHQEMEQLSI